MQDNDMPLRRLAPGASRPRFIDAILVTVALACAAMPGVCPAGEISSAGIGASTGDVSATGTPAAGNGSEQWNARFQSTYVWQEKPAFAAAYSGANSLTPDRETSYSFTATAALGYRPWKGGELYLDPEAAQGHPLSGLTGLGGFTNGEIARSSGPMLTVYRARLFLRQTWGMGGGQEAVESGANQLAGMVDRNRWVLTVGNLSVQDIFDDNAYSHDPRTQFLNWALMTHGAYDYAGDARGYTWGTALEWYREDWVLRAGRFIEPVQPNQQALDLRVFRHYGDQVEVEHAHELGDRPGKLRVLLFRDRALMASYRDALDLAAATASTPDINAVRDGDRLKQGIGINLEQALSADAGLFFRASRADGRTETEAFTEIDNSVSGGAVLKGTAWGRGQDSVGFAAARNGLSNVQREYLAAGGLGFFVGDGRLNYRPEILSEAFYAWSPVKRLWLTLDGQYVRNPAYNADRGPVRVVSVRLHTEF